MVWWLRGYPARSRDRQSSSQRRMARASMTRRNATPNPVGLPLRFQSMLSLNTLLGVFLLIVYPVFSSILCSPLTVLLNLPPLFLNYVSDLSSVLHNILLFVHNTLLQIRLLR